LNYVVEGTIIGVGTGSTANFFIDAEQIPKNARIISSNLSTPVQGMTRLYSSALALAPRGV
jgi:ribose 5-phosphate isomerase